VFTLPTLKWSFSLSGYCLPSKVWLWEKGMSPLLGVVMVLSLLLRAHSPRCLLSLPRNYKTFRDSWGKFIIKYSATSMSYYLLTE
jgi:hypothetical protein